MFKVHLSFVTCIASFCILIHRTTVTKDFHLLSFTKWALHYYLWLQQYEVAKNEPYLYQYLIKAVATLCTVHMYSLHCRVTRRRRLTTIISIPLTSAEAAITRKARDRYWYYVFAIFVYSRASPTQQNSR